MQILSIFYSSLRIEYTSLETLKESICLVRNGHPLRGKTSLCKHPHLKLKISAHIIKIKYKKIFRAERKIVGILI